MDRTDQRGKCHNCFVIFPFFAHSDMHKRPVMPDILTASPAKYEFYLHDRTLCVILAVSEII